MQNTSVVELFPVLGDNQKLFGGMARGELWLFSSEGVLMEQVSFRQDPMGDYTRVLRVSPLSKSYPDFATH